MPRRWPPCPHSPSRCLIPDAVRTDVDQLLASASPIPRPAGWAAWPLSLDEVEFWHGSVDRFHRRLRYRRVAERYEVNRLQP